MSNKDAPEQTAKQTKSRIAHESRAFKGIWIPAEVWLCDDLTIMEMLFLVEIDSLDNSKGCTKSNKGFAGFFGVSAGRASQIINDLKRKGWIQTKEKKEGKQVVERSIRVVRKLNTPSKYSKGGYLENDEDRVNNIRDNNNRKKEESKNQTVDEIRSTLFEGWKKLFPNRPQPMEYTWRGGSNHYKNLKSRIFDHPNHQQKEFWVRYLRAVSKTEWYGPNQTGNWHSLSWFVKKENFEKVLEKIHESL